MRPSGMRIAYHRWRRVIHKENTAAYLPLSESAPTVPTRQLFRILPEKGYKKFIIVSSSHSRVLGILVVVNTFC